MGDPLAEDSESIRRAASRAAQREWDWSNPICPSCEEQHPPDECSSSYDGDDEGEEGGPFVLGPVVTCLAHLEPEPCSTCAAYIAAGL